MSAFAEGVIGVVTESVAVEEAGVDDGEDVGEEESVLVGVWVML